MSFNTSKYKIANWTFRTLNINNLSSHMIIDNVPKRQSWKSKCQDISLRLMTVTRAHATHWMSRMQLAMRRRCWHERMAVASGLETQRKLRAWHRKDCQMACDPSESSWKSCSNWYSHRQTWNSPANLTPHRQTCLLTGKPSAHRQTFLGY